MVQRLSILFFVFVMTFIFAFPASANPYSAGLIRSKTPTSTAGTLTSGTWANAVDGSDSTSLVIPNQNQASATWSFTTAQDIKSIYVLGSGELRVIMLDSNNQNIADKNLTIKNGTQYDFVYNDVKSVTLYCWLTSSSCTLNEIDLYTTPPPDLTPPANVSSLTALNVTSEQLDLSFNTPSTSDFDRYKIYQNDALIFTSASSQAKSSHINYHVAGLNPSTNYNFKVSTVDVTGNESSGSTITVKTNAPPDVEAPDTPSNLTATPHDGSVTLTWDAPSSSDLAGYKVYLNGTKVNSSLITGTTFIHSVPNNVNHSWTVSAVDITGNESGQTSPIVTHYDTISPIAPVGLTATTISEGTVKLQWTPNNEPDLAGYSVYINNEKVTGDLIVASEYTEENVQNNTTYTFEVTASDTSGNESPKSSTITYFKDTLPPSVPEGLTAAAGDTTIDLSWTSVDGATGYNVYQRSYLIWTKVNVGLINGTNYKLTELDNNNSYVLAVTSVDQDGNESERSASVSSTPKAPASPAPGTGIIYEGSLGFEAKDVFLNSVTVFGFLSMFLLLAISFQFTPKIIDLVRDSFK